MIIDKADNYDVIIVGQGLAGSLLAWQLIKSGKRVFVIDNHHHQAASSVASGLFNPVTGRRLHSEQNVQELIACAISTYRVLEIEFDDKLFIPLDMHRIARSIADHELWLKRRSEPIYRHLLGAWLHDQPYSLRGEFGGFAQLSCHRLDIAKLLHHIKGFLIRSRCYSAEKVDYDDITCNDKLARVNNRSANIVIFCEGHQARHNPWFNDIQWDISRGDILHFESDATLPMIVNNGYNYIPISAHEFHWGSSFEHNASNPLPNKKGLTQLLDKLEETDTRAESYTLLAQYSGLRAATRDKRPAIGVHPELNTLGIFNGFGARGSLLIPFYAHHFSQVLNQRHTLINDVDWRRYASVQT